MELKKWLIFEIIRPPYRIIRGLLHRFIYFINKFVKINSVNIGGGTLFSAIGWLNLEEIKSIANPHPFKLTSKSIFPLKNASVNLAYSSNCLEHLDTETVYKVIEETQRVLKKGGAFIIKIPNFDRILDRWKNNDSNYFYTDWELKRARCTWKNRKLQDCLDYRAATLFCSFPNDEYGNHYITDRYSKKYFKKISTNKLVYYGPPIVSIEFLRELVKNHTPAQISAELCKIVVKNEKNYHFHHQNAWSSKELTKLLALYGFRIISFDANKIISKFKHIPNIKGSKRQSMYCWAEKL